MGATGATTEAARSSANASDRRPDARRAVLHRRIRLIVAATIGYNVVEAIVAIAAGSIASSVALIGFVGPFAVKAGTGPLSPQGWFASVVALTFAAWILGISLAAWRSRGALALT